MARFGIRLFRSIQRSNYYGSEALVLRGMCTNPARLSSIRSGRLRSGSNNGDTVMCERHVLAEVFGVRWSRNLDINSIMFIMFFTSG